MESQPSYDAASQAAQLAAFDARFAGELSDAVGVEDRKMWLRKARHYLALSRESYGLA